MQFVHCSSPAGGSVQRLSNSSCHRGGSPLESASTSSDAHKVNPEPSRRHQRLVTSDSLFPRLNPRVPYNSLQPEGAMVEVKKKLKDLFTTVGWLLSGLVFRFIKRYLISIDARCAFTIGDTQYCWNQKIQPSSPAAKSIATPSGVVGMQIAAGSCLSDSIRRQPTL